MHTLVWCARGGGKKLIAFADGERASGREENRSFFSPPHHLRPPHLWPGRDIARGGELMTVRAAGGGGIPFSFMALLAIGGSQTLVFKEAPVVTNSATSILIVGEEDDFLQTAQGDLCIIACVRRGSLPLLRNGAGI